MKKLSKLNLFYISGILPAVFILSLTGCVHKPQDTTVVKHSSILPTYRSVRLLNAIANDPGQFRMERARAICTVFAGNIRPGATVYYMRAMFPNMGWLDECRVKCLRPGEDGSPVEGDGTLYKLDLFPTKSKSAGGEWSIYFILTGELKDEDGLNFLKGKRISGNPRLLKFALCFPNRYSGLNHIEIYEKGGMKSYDLSE